MATNTATNIGIRQNFGGSISADRNFEDDGTVQYKCNHEGLCFLGTTYSVGDSLPFDAGGSPNTYTTAALGELLLFWNQGWLTPAS